MSNLSMFNYDERELIDVITDRLESKGFIPKRNRFDDEDYESYDEDVLDVVDDILDDCIGEALEKVVDYLMYNSKNVQLSPEEEAVRRADYDIDIIFGK